VTVFFSDIAGFTSISEKLQPEALVTLLNQYLSEMSDIVLNNRGTVDKFIGDAVMAIFGAPVDYPDHAASACVSALKMQERLLELNKKWSTDGFPPVNCRVGLNTGDVLVGNMGSSRRMDYTVMGDEVNLASRLEGANKAYGTRLMISEATYLDAKDVVEARELDLLAVVGKQKPVRVYQLLAQKGALSPEMAKLLSFYAQALSIYRQARFADALEAFQKCLAIIPDDSVTKVYIERCRTYIENPPPADWDGVWRLTKK
jgi:adenylate cyclase